MSNKQLLSNQAFQSMNNLIRILRFQASQGKDQFKRYTAILLYLIKEEIGEEWLDETDQLIDQIRDFEVSQASTPPPQESIQSNPSPK